MRHVRRLLPYVLTLFCGMAPAFGDITIRLKNSFISKYKNRATIEDECFIDKPHQKPNPPAKDADIHIAGRCRVAGLPTVAEIMNAAEQPEALKAVQTAATATPQRRVSVKGAWRLWCEHGGSSKQIQGQAMPERFTTTNPDHVFEIHPVSAFGDIDVRATFHTITGFVEKDAATAFTAYERTRCRIQRSGATTTILTSMAGYNYVKFIIRLNEDPRDIEDGVQVFANIRDLDDELLVRNRRMVFVDGTTPAKIVRTMKKDWSVTVLGIPRINLSLVDWRATNGATQPEILDWDLPYEMIIVGIYDKPRPPGENE